MSDNQQSQTQRDPTGQAFWTEWGLIDMVIPLLCTLTFMSGCCGFVLTGHDTFDGAHVGLPNVVRLTLIVTNVIALILFAVYKKTGRTLTWPQRAAVGALIVVAGFGMLQLIPTARHTWYSHVCYDEAPPKVEGSRHRACRYIARHNPDTSPCEVHLHSCTSTLKDGPQPDAPPWTLVRACEPLLKTECKAELATACKQEAALTAACERAHATRNAHLEECRFFKEDLCSIQPATPPE